MESSARIAVVGSVLLVACLDGSTETPPAVTFYQDALPILQTRCQGCHVTGGIGPFALETLADAQSRHAQLAQVVEARIMPPWMPSDGCQPLQGDRALSSQERSLLARWSDQGALAGDLSSAPPAPTGPAALPWVDLTLDSGADYTPNPPPGSKDDYHCFILRTALATDRYLLGYNIEPGARREVHHVALFETTMVTATASDLQEAGPGWSCFGGPGTGNSPLVGTWAPGSPVTQHPAGTGVVIPAGHVLVMQVHYNLDNGPPVPDRTRLQLQLEREPVLKPAQLVPVVDATFRLRPGQNAQVGSATWSVPADAVIWGVQPHMHTLGRRIHVQLSNPDSSSCLIDIPQWQFNWQQLYFFADPAGVPARAGSSVKVTCTWDNPSSREITFGEATSDEMCVAVLYVTRP